MTEWHTWDEVSAELGDVLGSTEERVRRVEQLRRGLVLRRLVEQRKRAGLRQVDVAAADGCVEGPGQPYRARGGRDNRAARLIPRRDRWPFGDHRRVRRWH
ncbi:MAG: hypothetical protein ACRDRS_09740 [Pseudonocardiaceae bacterium]